MTLYTCLNSLCGYGVILLNRGGRLVIQSATYSLNDTQTVCLKTHKALLLSILPDKSGHAPGDLLGAIEAYDERVAIMSESGESIDIIQPVAAAQARTALLFLPA